MKEIFISFTLLIAFSVNANVQTKGTKVKGYHKPKRWVRPIVHRPIKHQHVRSNHKKHDVLTLAAPPSVVSVLPSTRTMTLMPNGVPTAAGEYVQHLMHHHPLNIPVYHGGDGIYPVHVPEHFGPLGPFGHHRFYRHRLWPSFGYGVNYPYAHGFVSGPWYGPLPGHAFGYGYHRHYGRRQPRRHGPAGYWYGLGHGYRRGFFHRHGYSRSRDGNWWFNPITGWYPYSFDHSVDLRGDNGPETMFVERSLVPTSHKGSRVHSKVKRGRMTETARNGEKMKRLRVVYPARHRQVHHGSAIGRKLIPFGFRIQRYKLSLIPFKGKLNRPSEFQKFKNALKKSFKLSLKNSLKKPVQNTFKKSIRKFIKKSRKIAGLKRH